jgi:hypothetical protein
MVVAMAGVESWGVKVKVEEHATVVQLPGLSSTPTVPGPGLAGHRQCPAGNSLVMVLPTAIVVLDHCRTKVTTPKCDTWSSSGVGCKCFGDQLVSKWKENCIEVVSEFLEMG